MKIRILASGSDGNATLIETPVGKILIDAGIPLYKLMEFFEQYGKPDVVLITHSHGDHIKSAGALGRKLKVPIYMHPLTYKEKQENFNKCDVKFLNPGITPDLQLFGDTITVKPFNTQHDTAACIGFVIQETGEQGKKLCFITDTGCFTRLMKHATEGCDGYIIETDYDEEELEKTAVYDDALKDRIRSDFGHLSNQQAIEYCQSLDLSKTEFVILIHLSKNTNSPELARKRFEEVFPNEINKFLIEPFNLEITL